MAASTQSASGIAGRSGPQALVLRIPKAGAPPRVYAYPRADSTVWRATDPAPAPSEILGFHNESGSVAYEDARARPVLLELRLGTQVVASTKKLTGLASADGNSIYGIGPNGDVVRITATGEWTYKPPQPANAVFPQPEGGLLVSVGKGANTRLLRLHPPEKKILDSLPFPVATRIVRTEIGDRVYLAVDSGLVVLRTRTMDWAPSVPFDEPIARMASTPSGDRVFVLTQSRKQIAVVDRYREEVTAELDLPGKAEDLRVDPFGRYLLVRAADRDSIWVLAIGTERLIGALRSVWRQDLPFVGYDGAVAVTSGNDVVLVDGETLKPKHRIRGGALDFWYPFLWDGFRPRSASLDQPVTFDSVVGVAGDTLAGDSTGVPVASPTPGAPGHPAGHDSAGPRGFILSFAAFLTEDRARELATKISVGGENARVVATARGGSTIYRVVLGPYLSKEEAERAGKQSGHAYWVFEDVP
ncbi:MAG: SPOR domain-containing protein [Gemmatimonadaceae bacterium]